MNKAIIVSLIVILLASSLVVAEVKVTKEQNAILDAQYSPPNILQQLLNYIGNILGTGLFSIAGEKWHCDSLPYRGDIFSEGDSVSSYYLVEPGSSVAISDVDDWCPAGRGLLDTFVDWIGETEYKNKIDEFYCPSSASECQIQLYCCENLDCFDDLDCENWFGEGYECISTSEKDPLINFDWSSWSYCEFTGEDPNHRCWRISGSQCEEKQPPYKQSYLDDNFGGNCPPTWSYESLSECVAELSYCYGSCDIFEETKCVEGVLYKCSLISGAKCWTKEGTCVVGILAYPLKWSEFFSMNDEKFVRKAVGFCKSDADCVKRTKSDYKVLCDKTEVGYYEDRILKIAHEECDENWGWFNELFSIASSIFGKSIDLCEVEYNDISQALGTTDYGACVMESTTWYGKLWEQSLKVVGGMGFPAQYVMIITILILITVVGLIIRSIT